MPKEVITELKNKGFKFKLNGKTSHGSKSLDRVRIIYYPDHCDSLKKYNSDIASWKRLAICILKNDHTCKYIGLSPTKEQMVRQKEISKKV